MEEEGRTPTIEVQVMPSLLLGTTKDGDDFSVPLDAVARKFATIGVSGSGKTCAVAVMAERMYQNGLLWIAMDTVGTWWGLRSGRDGSPTGGLDVVVIGGEHADIELHKEKGYGKKVAEAVLSENVCAVLDLSFDSKAYSRTFLADFCETLMEMRPKEPRHIFVEEAPEFIPQHAKYPDLKRCAAEVERLVRLGRNRGYGVTLVSQRAATISKDALTQCENLIVMRMSHKLDRKALKDWIEAKAVNADLEECWNSMATLKSGEAWFWSPEWLGVFERVQFNQRTTYHPGETRTVGQKAKSVVLADVQSFVEKVNRQLSRVVVPAPTTTSHARSTTAPSTTPPAPIFPRWPPRVTSEEATAMLEEFRKKYPEVVQYHVQVASADVHEENLKLRAANATLKTKLDAALKVLKPEYEKSKALARLFEEVSESSNGAVNKAAYEPWMAKAGRTGAKRLLEILLDRPELTRNQLATLGGVSVKSSTFRTYMAWFKRNGLTEVDGDIVRLLPV